MWSSSFLRRSLAAVLLCALPVLSGCTLSPVYSSKESSEQLRLSYDEPKDRLDELVYQDLKLRFPPYEGPDANFVRITVSAKASTLTRSKTNNPVVNRLMTATGTIRVISENGEGETLLSTSRTASASYTTNGQILADQQALRAAQEQAMHALAETIRQMLLAELTQ